MEDKIEPTDDNRDDNWTEYLLRVIEEKDQYIDQLLLQIEDLLSKLKGN